MSSVNERKMSKLVCLRRATPLVRVSPVGTTSAHITATTWPPLPPFHLMWTHVSTVTFQIELAVDTQAIYVRH
jgi:hypothetical protein